MEESVPSTATEGEIIGIRFGLASHHEIRTSSISDCPISHASQLGNPFLGLPLETGKCESCGTAEPGKCEGHFGYIELPIPVYHPSHISELRRMLSLICLKCLKMKTNKVPMKSNGVMERLLSGCCEEACHVSIKENKKNDGASFLELRLPGRSRVPEGAWNFLERYGYRYGDGSSRTLLGSEVLVMLKKLPEDSKRKLAKKGYFPQDGYILLYLPVPPNCLSVPDISDGVSVMSSDLCSAMLKKVLRQIEIIRSSRSGEPNFESHEVEANDLQIAASQYLEVRGTSKAARDGDKRFGVSKEGSSSSTKAWLEKMRTLFISKGSGYSSRSVITGDAYIPVNEVGIPSEIAQKMTFEERVNAHNIEFLQNLVNNNLCLTFRDGSSTYSLREGSKGHTFLRIGQVVHRRIMDGDTVFINRPPTTHKHSLQALHVYIHDDHVVKINPLMCHPLAADFDGDCVHLFYPQSMSARAEVVELFSVDKQLLSSHSGNLNLQLATDALLSLKTIFKVYFLDKASAQQLAMHASAPLPSPAVRKTCSSGPRWTAQQVLQTALPPQFECHGERLLIRGSEVVKLDFNRDAIGSVVNDILTSLFFNKSPKEALNFFDSLQPLLMENLFAEGFSVCLRDFFVPLSELQNLQNQIQDISPLLLQLRSSFNELVQLQFENYIRHLKLPVANFILKSSALGNLIDSRSESGIDKIVQQIGFLGLQLSDRRKFYSKGLVEEVASLFRVKYPFANSFPSEEFGLVKSCFFHGLDPYEEMVHSIATREVIVRSSKGLAEPGTLFKNLMAVLRDVVICYDGSVRNVSSNCIIQFEYGLGGVPSESLFPAGEPVGVLAATAMSNPAYKAVLDSSPSSNSSWDLMKEILFCRVNFKNDLSDRRVILYLNDCGCGRKYCQENASFVVKNHLKKVSLRDAAIEFSIEYKRPKVEPGSTDIDTGLVGHIHLNAALLKESSISVHDILQKCEEQVNIMRKKKKSAYLFKRIALSVSECCFFHHPSSRWIDMPCLKFVWQDMADPHLEKISHIMADNICPVLLDTIIKGDPRISTVNIIWISPGTTSWVQSPCSDRKGELAVEVTLEKTAVRQSGDAWRTVLDCCLPVFHLIDSRRSIPYAIKQVQHLLGISCAFDQAVQRLSTSVTLVTKGVLKEHLILLASSMTCSGNLVGFNMSGIKALCRALSVQVPFTEATLYTPRKCFERASEKCHVDTLAGIVASSSWGKRVAVGTGAKFDILWDTRESDMSEKPIDVYNFLHLVRSSNEVGVDTGCLGEDVENFDPEDAYMDPALSPDQENKAVFEDSAEFGLDSQEPGGGDSSWDAVPSSTNGWNTGSGSGEANGWSKWGAKKDQAQPEDSSSGGWETSKPWNGPKKNDSVDVGEKSEGSGGWNVKASTSGSAEGNGWSDWGPKKDQAQPGDSSRSGGGVGSKSWNGPEKTEGDVGEKSGGFGGWNIKASTETKALSSNGWNQESQIVSQELTTWGVSDDKNMAGKDDGQNSSWEKPSEPLLKKSSDEIGGDWSSAKIKQQNGSGKWGSQKVESNTQTSWTQESGSAWKTDQELGGSGNWDSQKEGNQAQSSWEQQNNSTGGTGGWASSKSHIENGSRSWDSEKIEKKSQSSGGQAGDSTWKSFPKNSDQRNAQSTWGKRNDSTAKSSTQSADKWAPQSGSSVGWGSAKSDEVGGSKSWESGKQDKSEVGGANAWGLKKQDRNIPSSWGQNESSPKISTPSTENWAPQSGSSCGWDSGKSNEVGGSKIWGSRKEAEPEVGGSNGWESKKQESKNQTSWGQPIDPLVKNSTQSSDKWANQGGSSFGNSGKRNESESWQSGKAESGSSYKVPEEAGSLAWESKLEEKKTQSSWGLPSVSPEKSSDGADGWGSKKSNQPGTSSSWGSEGADTGKNGDKKEAWGQPNASTWKKNTNQSSRGSDGWDSPKAGNDNDSQSPWAQPGWKKQRSEGGRGWGSSNSGEWKNRKNRPPQQPGASNDDLVKVALTATRKRMDLFPAEEQDALSEIESIMQSVRRIMHQSGCDDGDPLPSDDQSYIINNVLNYHPEKEAKMGAGIDFITVKKHSSFQESRCFYVVSTDGQSQDFSYIKCLENFIRGKYPSIGESFNSKYFRKPRPSGIQQGGSQQGNQSQDQPQEQ